MENEKIEIIDVPVVYSVEEEKKPRRKKGLWMICIILISTLLGGVIASYIMPVYIFGHILPYPDNYFGQNKKQVIQVDGKNTQFLVSAVAKKAMSSVVGITTQSVEEDFFFGRKVSQGLGTGVIVDKNGYILTNSHVVNNGEVQEVKVLFDNGKKKDAKIIWNDSMLDLAVLKVDGVNLAAADLGDSDDLQVGEVAIAIGNPLGMEFEKTVTSGIVSGLGRSVQINERESIENLIQTDASINPGNSGGPLLNSKGEVVGINTAKIQSGEGLGFAIPINMAKPIVDQFIQKGEFSKAYLGIKGVDVDVFEKYMNTDLSVPKGVYIAEITPNSPADKGDLRSGDIIVGIENQEISGMRELSTKLYQYRPEDTIHIKIMRNGKAMTLQIILEKIPKKYE
ncbi:serine protease HtrA [Inediibacterium massiliense]|uniref:serine protease HtrA n=1 Tax=Inediibacterium massiliense TaxID=1658111 RepID=UPI000ACBCE52|nr:trypsin-like peptidase domain-containing protein [Inediibacterium massiliense]